MGDAAAPTTSVTIPEAVSSSKVLRFAPVAFSRTSSGAGKFKVCFCDHGLLSGEACLSEADYSLEVGELYVSGVSCLIADKKYRRGTCYPMYHGGLACSETLSLPALTSLPASAGLPTSWSAFVSMLGTKSCTSGRRGGGAGHYRRRPGDRRLRHIKLAALRWQFLNSCRRFPTFRFINCYNS